MPFFSPTSPPRETRSDQQVCSYRLRGLPLETQRKKHEILQCVISAAPRHSPPPEWQLPKRAARPSQSISRDERRNEVDAWGPQLPVAAIKLTWAFSRQQEYVESPLRP